VSAIYCVTIINKQQKVPVRSRQKKFHRLNRLQITIAFKNSQRQPNLEISIVVGSSVMKRVSCLISGKIQCSFHVMNDRILVIRSTTFVKIGRPSG
jgi:hypothetical protein